MIKKLWELFQKHREALLYLIFGGLTTVLNYLVFVLCSRLLPVETTTIPNLIAWVVAVLFAYATNRIWVFQSAAQGFGAVVRELAAFAGARVFTLVLEMAILWIFVDYLGLLDLVVKIAANVLVIVLNYVFSKLWIFKKKIDPANEKNM